MPEILKYENFEVVRGEGMSESKARKKYGSKRNEIFHKYHVDDSFDQSVEGMNPEFIDLAMITKHRGINYLTRTHQSGNLFEVEVYPYFKSIRDLPNGIRLNTKESSKAQRDLNNKKARRKLTRLIHNNFAPGDYWITFTFRNEDLPNGLKDMAKIRKRYIERLNYFRKSKGLSNARYIYVEEEGEYGTERYHMHMVMDSDLTKEEVESRWKHGRVNIRTINYCGDRDMRGLCNYMVKDPETYKKTTFRVKGKRSWGSSKSNLKLPTPRYHVDKFRKKRVNEMAVNQGSIQEIFEREYPNYDFKNMEIRQNKYNGLFYIYVVMHDKRNIKARG